MVKVSPDQHDDAHHHQSISQMFFNHNGAISKDLQLSVLIRVSLGLDCNLFLLPRHFQNVDNVIATCAGGQQRLTKLKVRTDFTVWNFFPLSIPSGRMATN